jgi:3-hydroxyacyl-CoA dehydrogenase
MAKPIRKVGVIGAGVMGSGIAAHMANAGLEVVLLDIVPPNLTDEEKKSKVKRDGFAAGGLDKAIKARPAAFFQASFARLVRTGNTQDDLGLLTDCDLVIEAVFERIDVKRTLFDALEPILPETTIIASNTSGLRIEDMLQGRKDWFKKNFIVTHFFNPVRYMKLLELVVGPDTDPAVTARIKHFGEDVLGKGIVFGKDTPNFVGNRIGAYSMMLTIHEMLKDGLTPEDIDAITGLPMAHPKSASFRTADVVGLDTFAHVADNCYNSLLNDEERHVFQLPEYIRKMVEKKILGDKTKGGFYKRTKEGLETLDSATLNYRPTGGDEEIAKVCKKISREENLDERVRKLVAAPGKTGAFAWKILSRVFAYSARRIGEITDDITAIDNAMCWGYNWELGPFQAWDALGFVETTKRMIAEGMELPASIHKMLESGAKSFYRGDGSVYNVVTGQYDTPSSDPRNISLSASRKGRAPVLSNDGAEAWDLGDGILGLTLKSKANSIDPEVITILGQAAKRAEEDFRGMVIVNQGEFFCVGANLMLVLMAAQSDEWEQLRSMIKNYQNATQLLKYAKVPVVAAPYGMTLGGGLELCFGCDAVQAAAETYSGLVEVGVGLIPGGAGTLNMLWRSFESVPDGMTVNNYDHVTQVFKNIALAKVATSADEAKLFGYFRRGDGVSFDRSRQLYEAKARAIGMSNAGYRPPTPKAYKLPGESGIATLSMMVDTLVAGGYASEHDALIARKLANVLCGGVSGASKEVTEAEVLELECEAFLSLCGEPKSQERMQYMLMNNKPLRN